MTWHGITVQGALGVQPNLAHAVSESKASDSCKAKGRSALVVPPKLQSLMFQTTSTLRL